MPSILSRRLVVVGLALVCSLARGAAQVATSNPFIGRWDVSIQMPAGESLFGTDKVSHFIIDITPSGSSLSAKFVDVASGMLSPIKIRSISSKDDELTMVVEMTLGTTLVFKGKRVNDRLEGTVMPDQEKEELKWVGERTVKDSLQASAPANEPRSEQAAYSAALTKAPAVRAAALQKFLKDFPDSSLKDQATLQLALSYPELSERQAALQRFITDFPGSFLKDQAAYQRALSAANVDDRVAALKAFVADYPASGYREQAAYQIVTLLPPGKERDAAREDFLKTYPTNSGAAEIYESLWETYLNQVPVDEAKLAAAIEGLINATPNIFEPAGGDQTSNRRAAALNTVADRLMTKEVMLDKALDVIQRAIALAGPSETARTRAMFRTTLGQVLFKLKDYARAEQELKGAIDIAGAEGDGEAWLFLGKIAEQHRDDASALDAYLKAARDGAPLDTTASLERLYLKTYGSLATLDDKLAELDRARPRLFDAGHFTRSGPTATTPSRVVLAELFTGAECAPCIAADMAVDGLAERYDHDTLAVLVYHLHVPGPDPMTNEDTEARAKYYKVQGTPTILVDGLGPSSGGGTAPMAATLFSSYTKRVESRLEKLPLAQLTNFRATSSGQTITVSGDAELLASATGVDKARLHLALVQDAVRYTGTNGVRVHTFVVRELIGSPDGKPLQKPGTKTPVTETIDVAVVGQILDTYLQGYEPKVKPAGFKFGNRADALDAKHLSIVAFVQDETTKEILQALLITPSR